MGYDTFGYGSFKLDDDDIEGLKYWKYYRQRFVYSPFGNRYFYDAMKEFDERIEKHIICGSVLIFGEDAKPVVRIYYDENEIIKTWYEDGENEIMW